MHQSKKDSLVEAITSNIASIALVFLTQMYLFPYLDIHISPVANLKVTLAIGVVTTLKSYLLRRYFNNLAKRRAQQEEQWHTKNLTN